MSYDWLVHFLARKRMNLKYLFKLKGGLQVVAKTLVGSYQTENLLNCNSLRQVGVTGKLQIYTQLGNTGQF